MGRMGRAGLAPDSFSYRAAVQACGADTAAAAVLLDRMEAAAGGGELTPSPLPYGAAIAGAADAGAWQRCLELVKRMDAAGVAPDEGCYRPALASCHRAERWEELYELLYEMRGRGLLDPSRARPYLRGMWKQAKRQLGFHTEEPRSKPRRPFVPGAKGRARGKSRAK